MSLSFNKIDVVPVQSAVTNVSKPVQYMAYLGGSTVTYKEVVSTSYSQSQVSFAANPPSPNVIVDRSNVLLKCPVRLTFTGTPSLGGRLLNSQYDAFRAFPLHSVMNSLQLTINSTKFTIESSELVHEMMMYYGENREQEHLSLSPCFPDQSQEYAENVNSNNNPLAQVNEKTGVGFRGAFPYTLVSNPLNGTTAVVEATLTEALMISPLLWGGNQGKGLLHTQNLHVQINWDSNLSRMWSHADGSGSTISNIQVQFLQPSLSFKYITPSPTMELPRSVMYDLQDTEVYVNDLNALQAPNAEYSINSSNIQLNVVPSHLLIFTKMRRGDRSFETTDSWQGLQSIDLSFANVSGILSGATKQELYNISRSNGINQSWASWSAEPQFVMSGSQVQKNGPGGILCLKFGKDIALSDPSVTVGTPGTYNLYCRLTCKNYNQTRSISPSLYVVPIYAGCLTLQDNQSIQQLAILSQADVLKASDEAQTEAIDGSMIEGGKFFGDVSNMLSKALPYVRKARKIGQAISGAIPTPQAQVVRGVLDVAEQVGLGKKKKKGGVLIGGKQLSRSEMRQALQL